MQIFYAPDIYGDSYTMDEKESKHIIRVLRMDKGSRIRLVDGKGNLYEGVISNTDYRKCSVNITGIIKNFEQRNYALHIAISPLKNPDRFEWFVEKSVEIGIDQITPLICRNTEKYLIKTDRINKLIISAMKQSLKAYKTELNDTILFSDFVVKDINGRRYISHCNDSLLRNNISDVYSKNEDAIILIGPEGDFDDTEITYAIENNYVPVHLGKSRLRTETAGIAACHSVYFLNQ